MSAEDDDNDNSSTAAVLMKCGNIGMKDQSDVHSLRSMPLQKDDDYFYYHGHGNIGKEDDEDEETVDHIGLLIGPMSVQYPATIEPREMRSSLRSMASEITYDEYVSDLEEVVYTTNEYIEMKLQIADLKAQLDNQQFQHQSAISSLRDRILSLECENVGLKQELKESQDVALREREEARRMERLLQGMCASYLHLNLSSVHV